MVPKRNIIGAKILLSLMIIMHVSNGQVAFGKPDIPEEVQIPVEYEAIENSMDDESARSIDYSENLWEITDDGILDEKGEYMEDFKDDEPKTVEEKIIENAEGEASKKAEDIYEAFRQSIEVNWGGKRAFAERRLQGIRENLQEEFERFRRLDLSVIQAEERVKPIREKIETLKDHINLLNEQLRLAKKKITDVEVKIAEKQLSIKKIMQELKRKQIALDIQREIALDYITLLYEEENQFLDMYSEGTSTLKLLLADASISENMLGREYMKVMEEAGRKVFNDLDHNKRNLEEKKTELETEQANLEYLDASLNEEKNKLEETRQAKRELLEETQGEDERYQQLLDESIRQQMESAIAIQNLRDNMTLIEEKLKLLDETLEEVRLEGPEAEEEIEVVESKVSEKITETEEIKSDLILAARTLLGWPVSPNKITAYYHDPTYPKKWGIHEAIDIRAKQGTEMRAPADGYVFQTKNNGMGYSYIIIAHKHNIMTVYGHVMKIIAKPGTIIRKGDVIGLTGGMPGTKGAGWQTTGPHLHFEVYYKGEHVNPLDYLPLEELPIEYVPDEYLEDLN